MSCQNNSLRNDRQRSSKNTVLGTLVRPLLLGKRLTRTLLGSVMFTVNFSSIHCQADEEGNGSLMRVDSVSEMLRWINGTLGGNAALIRPLIVQKNSSTMNRCKCVSHYLRCIAVMFGGMATLCCIDMTLLSRANTRSP